MPEQENTQIQDQQSPDATTTTDLETTISDDGTETTTMATGSETGSETVVVLSEQQYNDLIQTAKDSNMIESILLTVLIGLFIGYIGVRGLFDAWRS
jgi:hypothetical protein